MGRGGDDLLGPLVSGRRAIKKKEETPLAPEPEGSFLFQPFKKQDSSLYRTNPTPAALRRASNIADEIKQGNFMPFLLVLDEKEFDITRYPAFRSIFDKLSAGKIDQILRKKKIPRRGKEAKAERETLQGLSAEVLAFHISRALKAAEGIPVSDQAAMLREISFVDDQFLAELALRAKTEGPARQFYVNALRRTPLEKMTRSTLEFLTAKKNKEGGEIFEEVMRREAVSLLYALKHDGSPQAALEYGCLRLSYSGPSTMHIKSSSGGTLCGSRERFYSGTVSYGDWSDGPYRGDFKQCPKCVKAADEVTLERLNSERGDLAKIWIDEEEQEKIISLSRDGALKRIVKANISQGKSPEETKEAVREHMASRVADVLASSADKYDDGKNSIYYFGGGHLAWSQVNQASKAKLQNLGYKTPGVSYRYRHMGLTPGQMHPDLMQRSDDVLFKATSAEERRKFFRYRARGVVTQDRVKKREYMEKADTILNRAVRRFTRNHP